MDRSADESFLASIYYEDPPGVHQVDEVAANIYADYLEERGRVQEAAYWRGEPTGDNDSTRKLLSSSGWETWLMHATTVRITAHPPARLTGLQLRDLQNVLMPPGGEGRLRRGSKEMRPPGLYGLNFAWGYHWDGRIIRILGHNGRGQNCYGGVNEIRIIFYEPKDSTPEHPTCMPHPMSMQRAWHMFENEDFGPVKIRHSLPIEERTLYRDVHGPKVRRDPYHSRRTHQHWEIERHEHSHVTSGV